jgi:hypothetical protein
VTNHPTYGTAKTKDAWIIFGGYLLGKLLLEKYKKERK